MPHHPGPLGSMAMGMACFSVRVAMTVVLTAAAFMCMRVFSHDLRLDSPFDPLAQRLRCEDQTRGRIHSSGALLAVGAAHVIGYLAHAHPADKWPAFFTKIFVSRHRNSSFAMEKNRASGLAPDSFISVKYCGRKYWSGWRGCSMRSGYRRCRRSCPRLALCRAAYRLARR